MTQEAEHQSSAPKIKFYTQQEVYEAHIGQCPTDSLFLNSFLVLEGEQGFWYVRLLT